MCYNFEFKMAAIRLHTSMHLSIRKIASCLQIGRATISRWLSIFLKDSKIRTGQYKGRAPIFNSKQKKIIINQVIKNPLITLTELQSWIELELGLKSSISTLSRLLKKEKLSKKTVYPLVRSVVDQRKIVNLFKAKVGKQKITEFMCLDEVGFQLEMTRKRGWSKKGHRCYTQKRRKGRKNYHGIFIIHSSGSVFWKIYDHPINKNCFQTFIESLKDPILANKTLVLDNLRIHHNKEVISKIKTKFTKVLWTPAYSPELNPIESMFHSLKSYLRSLSVNTKTELEAGVQAYINKLAPDSLLPYYKHSWL